MLGGTGLAPSATDEVGPSKGADEGPREEPSRSEEPREDSGGALPARSPRETSRESGTESSPPSRAAPPPSEPSGDASGSAHPPQPLLPAPACVGSAEEPLPRPGEQAERAASTRGDSPAAAPPCASGAVVLDIELFRGGSRGDPLLEA